MSGRAFRVPESSSVPSTSDQGLTRRHHVDLPCDLTTLRSGGVNLTQSRLVSMLAGSIIIILLVPLRIRSHGIRHREAERYPRHEQGILDFCNRFQKFIV
jgi:hypothetical protein